MMIITKDHINADVDHYVTQNHPLKRLDSAN